MFSLSLSHYCVIQQTVIILLIPADVKQCTFGLTSDREEKMFLLLGVCKLVVSPVSRAEEIIDSVWMDQ